ncbi:MAG: riboflavin synthase [Candidatus Peregrinibacteria bacterium Gr01-1014_25]|nr:MAG: riboflavin synthase [Candidatus Peregrinibacteria bacterium Gr01-1014_25]
MAFSPDSSVSSVSSVSYDSFVFTGIVEATGTVIEKRPHRLTVARPKTFRDLKIGSSISVAGVCLSVVEKKNTTMSFDVVDETLARTTLGSLREGDCVNLERSLKAGDRFEGHIVQGHVEGVGTVISRRLLAASAVIGIRLPAFLATHVVPKGSIAIDGVSLTVAFVKDGTITVALIPHTLAMTTLGLLQKGDRVNIETDIVARYARR